MKLPKNPPELEIVEDGPDVLEVDEAPLSKRSTEEGHNSKVRNVSESLSSPNNCLGYIVDNVNAPDVYKSKKSENENYDYL